MRQLMLGVVIGASMMASLGFAGNLYDRSGQPAAPRGSIQQYDAFRQRGQQLDIQHLRQQADRESLAKVPCGK